MNRKNKKRQLFGNNIKPSCEYCRNAIFNSDGFICTENRTIVDYKCKKFVYDPLLRVPKAPMQTMHTFSKKDFEL